MKIGICEDILEHAKLLQSMVEEYYAAEKTDCEMVLFSSGTAALESEFSAEADLFFIDIELGDMTGTELIKRLHEINPACFFAVTTAYRKYLDDAIDLRVLRFLDKPLDKERVFSALQKAEEEMNSQMVVIKGKNNKTYRFKQEDVIYAESKFKKSFITTTDMLIETPLPFKDVKALLSSPIFLVPHASFIINKNYIVRFERQSITIRENKKDISIPVSPKKQPEMRSRLI